jgi:peptidoglycan/LPS O-acetylase OafA/YrhL
MRAWLAWTVVAAHICQIVGMDIRGGIWTRLDPLGHQAVMVFIAISGFVIAGLVLDKQESWPRYITRRAFRIFPAYWIAFALALAIFPLAVAQSEAVGWARNPAYVYDDLMRSWSLAITQHPWSQMALHLTLLQGVVAESVWPFTGTAVLGPAWSLTLEWQFYLLAPALVWLMARPGWRSLTTLAAFACAYAFNKGVFGNFFLPSFLPGAAYVFVIGIASRLWMTDLQRVSAAPAFVIGALAFGLLARDYLWLSVWLCLLAFIVNEARWRGVLPTAMRLALTSRFAGYFGARSYAIYVLHLPIIQLTASMLTERFALTQPQLFWALIIVVPPIAILAADLLHRFVERPMIRLGAKLATPRVPPTQIQPA